MAACPDSRWRVYPAGAGRAADGASRAVGPLGATWQGFLRIAGGQVVLAGLLGDAWNHVHLLSAWRDGVVLPLIATAVGAGLLLRAVRSGGDAAISFMSFTLLVFTAALLSPQLSTTAQWAPGSEGRVVGKGGVSTGRI